MKKVLITQRSIYLEKINETRDSLDQRLCDFISQCGFTPVPVPNSLHSGSFLRNWLDNMLPFSVVLSGGEDYGVNDKRDSLEFEILDYAEQKSIPVIGICRGMQILAYYSGQNNLKKIKNHSNTRHRVNGFISKKVNSYHNYSLVNQPAFYNVWAESEDGQIEAIKHNVRPWLGIMWHPEREKCFPKTDLELFKMILKQEA